MYVYVCVYVCPLCVYDIIWHLHAALVCLSVLSGILYACIGH